MIGFKEGSTVRRGGNELDIHRSDAIRGSSVLWDSESDRGDTRTCQRHETSCEVAAMLHAMTAGGAKSKELNLFRGALRTRNSIGTQ